MEANLMLAPTLPYKKLYLFWSTNRPLVSLFEHDKKEPRGLVILLVLFIITRCTAIIQIDIIDDRPLVLYADFILVEIVLIEGLYNWFWLLQQKRELLQFIVDLEEICTSTVDPALLERICKTCYIFNTGASILIMTGTATALLWPISEVIIAAIRNKTMMSSHLEGIFWVPRSLHQLSWVFTLINALLGWKVVMLRVGILLTLTVKLRLLAASFSALQRDILRHGAYVDVNNLGLLVRRHQKLLDLATRLNKVYEQQIIPIIFLTFAFCCFLLFIITTNQEHDMHFVLSFVSGILLQYIYYWHGQLLLDTSAGIADSVCESDWINVSPKCRRMLLVIIIRAQRPCCVTAKNYLPANLFSFLKAIKAMFSLVSFFVAVTKSKNNIID